MTSLAGAASPRSSRPRRADCQVASGGRAARAATMPPAVAAHAVAAGDRHGIAIDPQAIAEALLRRGPDGLTVLARALLEVDRH